jgi:hypothetical protein
VSTDPTASPTGAAASSVPPPPPGDPGAPAPVDPNQPNWAGFIRVASVAAIAGLGLFIALGGLKIAGASDEEAGFAKRRFASAFLTSYTFWLSLPVGAMALLLIHHLVKSSWGLLLRQFFEAATRTIPLIIVMWIILGAILPTSFSPYWWTHPQDIHVEPGPDAGTVLSSGNPDKRDQAIQVSAAMVRRFVELQQKFAAEDRDYRDQGNFNFLSNKAWWVVGGVLFLIWCTMIFYLNKWGTQAREASGREAVEAVLAKPNALGGPGLIIYGITITAAASQWVMSVEPSWSSTMFPVIYAVNQFLTAFALCLALFLLLSTKSPFKEVMRPKFQIDMGTLLLAFTLFWSYTSFSQFMLVWIGNLPEEIPFFLRRSEGEWWYVSAILCVFHFALPFLLLLFRDIKMHPTRLRYVAIYLIVICAIDVMWWIAPSFPSPSGSGFPYWLLDIGAVVGIGGLWGLYFIYELRRRPLLPVSAMYRLPEGHHHEQH